MLKRIPNLKKMKPKLPDTDSKEFSLWAVFKGANKFIWMYKKTIILWLLANYVLLYIFTLIPRGWANSLSILWLVAYYVYWCIFVRYIQQHRPYFSLIRTMNGLIPTSKILFINIFLYVFIITIPYVPMFMGFRDKYLECFESYMSFIESYDAIPGKLMFFIILLLISPYTISRPYLAWLSSLIGKSRSIIDAYKKTKGNYWSFVIYFGITNSLYVISYGIDAICKTDSLFFIIPILTTYFNITAISIYKIFYKKQKALKPSLQ